MRILVFKFLVKVLFYRKYTIFMLVLSFGIALFSVLLLL